jgi:hypothetical protein
MALSALPMAVVLWGTVRSGVENGEGAIAPAFVVAGMAVALALLAALAWRRPRQFGLRWPQGLDWLALLPVALAGALFGGAWIALPATAAGRHPVAGLLAAGAGPLLVLLALPLLAEVVFRGLAHGVLVRRFRVQHPGGRWFVSGPTMLCALLYVAWSASVWLVVGSPAARLWHLFEPGAAAPAIAAFAAGAALVGVVGGLVRERSASLVAPVLFHLVALGAAVGALALAG